MNSFDELREDAHTRAFAIAAATDPGQLRLAIAVLEQMQGLSLTELKTALSLAFGLAQASATLDVQGAGITKVRAAVERLSKDEAVATRRAAYLSKARAEPGLLDRLTKLCGGRAAEPSLEQLEAEFGRDFVQQDGQVQPLDHADDGAAGTALNE